MRSDAAAELDRLTRGAQKKPTGGSGSNSIDNSLNNSECWHMLSNSHFSWPVLTQIFKSVLDMCELSPFQKTYELLTFFSWNHCVAVTGNGVCIYQKQPQTCCGHAQSFLPHATQALIMGVAWKEKLPQIKTREARCASKLLWSDNDYGFKCTTMSINWPFF